MPSHQSWKIDLTLEIRASIPITVDDLIKLTALCGSRVTVEMCGQTLRFATTVTPHRRTPPATIQNNQKLLFKRILAEYFDADVRSIAQLTRFTIEPTEGNNDDHS